MRQHSCHSAAACSAAGAPADRAGWRAERPRACRVASRATRRLPRCAPLLAHMPPGAWLPLTGTAPVAARVAWCARGWRRRSARARGLSRTPALTPSHRQLHPDLDHRPLTLTVGASSDGRGRAQPNSPLWAGACRYRGHSVCTAPALGRAPRGPRRVPLPCTERPTPRPRAPRRHPPRFGISLAGCERECVCVRMSVSR